MEGWRRVLKEKRKMKSKDMTPLPVLEVIKDKEFLHVVSQLYIQ